MSLKNDALEIIDFAVKSADPYGATVRLLEKLKDSLGGQITVFSIGKAAIPMAKAAEKVLGEKIRQGLVVTKYKHSGGYTAPLFEIIEAAHPVNDENSVRSAERALEICSTLNEDGCCVVLLSGGGSALFEKSLVEPKLQQEITEKLLRRGADIGSVNTIRKSLSLVKGGRLAAAIYPAKVYTIALSDVLSNDRGTIASGITVPDDTSPEKLAECVKKYIPEYSDIFSRLNKNAEALKINDGGYYFAGDINSLCNAAEKKAAELGYKVISCQRNITGEATEAAERILCNVKNTDGKTAYIYGGETTVTLKGNGVGGRNQEMALKAAIEIRDRKNILFASVGSDGTDGPCDAAGGIADGASYSAMTANGVNPEKELENNNSNYALSKADLLIVTGPTGTNVNDLTVVLTE